MAQDHLPIPIPVKGAEAKLDLRTLQNELHSMCAHWFRFGVQLGVDTSTLKRIEKQFRDDGARCLVEALIEWMKNKPSWKGIVEALRSSAIAEKSLADELERIYCPDELQRKYCPRTRHSSLPATFSTNFPLKSELVSAESDPIYRFEETLVSKELERMFLPSLNKLREKKEMEEKIATNKRDCKAMKKMRDLLRGVISNSREQASEETQEIEEIILEKESTIRRLRSELELAKQEYIQADKEMSKVRDELDKMWKNRKPVDTLELEGSWRIVSTEDGKLLASIIDSKGCVATVDVATVDEGIGRVALLERQGDKLLEREKQVIHRNDECTNKWTPAGIAVDQDDIFVGDVAGAVPPYRRREQLIAATTDTRHHQGKSKLLRFKLLEGEQVSEEQPLQVGDPSGMAFRKKSLYVCDRSKHQVIKLDRKNKCTTSYGKEGDGEGEFWKPTAIAFNDIGDIYVLDQGNNRVQVFSPEFRFLRTFGGRELEYPAYDIHVSKEFVYVTQTKLNCVSVFDKRYGIFVVSFSNKMLKHPVGIVADKEGYIYICGASNVWLF